MGAGLVELGLFLQNKTLKIHHKFVYVHFCYVIMSWKNIFLWGGGWIKFHNPLDMALSCLRKFLYNLLIDYCFFKTFYYPN